MLVAEQTRLRRRTERLAKLGLLTPPDPGGRDDARESDEPETPEEKARLLLFDQARRLATVEEALSTLTEAFMEKYKMIDPLLLGLDPREADEDGEGAREDGLPGEDEATDGESDDAARASDEDFDLGVEEDEEDKP